MMGVLADLFGIRMVFVFSGILLLIVSMMVYRSRKLLVRNGMER
ncbi:MULTISPECIES: hypothetical protein [unclassified Oceanobacillus]